MGGGGVEGCVAEIRREKGGAEGRLIVSRLLFKPV